MLTVCNKRWFRFGRLLIVIALGAMSSTGCRSFPSMTNSMCPPAAMTSQFMSPQGMSPQGMVGQMTPQGMNQANVPPYSVQPTPQGYMQPAPIPIGSEVGAENCVTATPSSIDVNAVQTTQDDSALQAVVSMADKLQASSEENAQLRKDLRQLAEDQRRHQGIAQKATQFADKLRSDNTRLKTDLTAWEQRLHQLESMVDSRESHQEDALVDIDSQLDQLIATYESDMASADGAN